MAASTQRNYRVKLAARNRQQKRTLVEDGRSHGIIVYAKGELVGWCQYGSVEELSRINNNRSYQRLAHESSAKVRRRITCFTVDKKYRKQGLANAALKAIRNKGGGVVEAYPIVRWGGYSEYLGTVSMFKKEGFETMALFGKSNVITRRTI